MAIPYKNLDVDETADQIKGERGRITFLYAVNMAATKRYLKFYDALNADVTVGTTVPVLTFAIPTTGDTNGAGFVFPIPEEGLEFRTGITVAATTGIADNDSGAPAANDVAICVGYRE